MLFSNQQNPSLRLRWLPASCLSLSFAVLVACGPSPSTGLAPASPSAMPSLSPTTAPSEAPTTEPATAPTAAPSTSPTSAPSSPPSASSAPEVSASPQASGTPAPSASPAGEVQALRDNFFKNYGINPFVEAATDPLSTFAVDVDTASYTVTRNYLNNNLLPPAAAVRTEEFLNYFDYHYPQPLNSKFAIHTDLVPAYFGDTGGKLMRVGVQGLEVLEKDRKNVDLTFVIDVSGSMNQLNRLELVKESLRILLNRLKATDRIGLVVYGTDARTVLPHTAANERVRIMAAIDSLRPEGSTNVEAGLRLGYAEASAMMRPGAVNRVILCSDGVANVGATGPEAILSTIKASSENGITLTTLGFGMGEYNDTLMEQLANQGDGNYAYIDSLDEAQKLLDEQLISTLQVIAKDVKIQVAFNPQLVDQYRLLGYENRDIADDDFRDDTVDAGEVGSNHSVTALYEVRFKPDAQEGDVASITVRYKDVDDAERVKELARTVRATDLVAFSSAPGSLRLATSVAEFAEILRNSIFAQGSQLSAVAELAATAQKAYPDDTRIQEFVTLAQKAAELQRPPSVQSLDNIVSNSQNPNQLTSWKSFLIKQLGGKSSQ